MIKESQKNSNEVNLLKDEEQIPKEKWIAPKLVDLDAKGGTENIFNILTDTDTNHS